MGSSAQAEAGTGLVRSIGLFLLSAGRWATGPPRPLDNWYKRIAERAVTSARGNPIRFEHSVGATLRMGVDQC